MATSKLQRAVGDLLDRSFPRLTIRENHRPDWLIFNNGNKLELDFFIEETKTAIEVQGSQHYEYSSFFHPSREDFEQQKRRDEEKKLLCIGNGVRLYEIFTELDAIILIGELQSELGIASTPHPKWEVYAKGIEESQEIRESPIDKRKRIAKRKAIKTMVKCYLVNGVFTINGYLRTKPESKKYLDEVLSMVQNKSKQDVLEIYRSLL